MSAVHYWWEGACYAAIACGQRGAVEGTTVHQDVTCIRCRRTQRFRSGLMVHRGR